MIPVQLTLEGIYSYQEKQTIDFATLTDNHIFGIFGGVGSGKSTILEAITFALYGDTERLNSRENRNYNMMNLKSNQLFIEFIFTAGKDNQKYKFNVSGKRNKNRFEDVKTLNRSAYIFEGGNWLPLESVNADNILGLSYENFKRTIIIPQGKFQEFLQLGETARTKMLQEIFRLDRFDLADKVKSLSTKVDRQLENYKGRLSGLEDISEEIIVQMESELTSFKEELSKTESQNKSLSEELSALEQLAKLFIKKEQLLTKLNQQKSKEEVIIQLETDLKDFQECKELFENDLTNLDKLIVQKASLQRDINEAQLHLANIEKELNTKKITFTEAEKEFANKSEYVKQTEDLQKIGRIKQINTILELKEKEIHATKVSIQDLEKTVSEMKQTLNSKEIEQDSLRLVKDNLSELKDIENWHKSLTMLKRELSNYSEKLENYRIKKNVQIKKRDSIHSDNAQLSDMNKDDIQGMSSKIEEMISQLEAEKDAEKTKMLKSEARTELAVQAKDLKEGDPCPVCGSTTHPFIKEFEIGTEIVAEATKILERIDAQMRILFQQKKNLSEVEVILRNIDTDINELENEILRVNAEQEDLNNEYKWDKKYQEDKHALDSDIKTAEAQSAQYETIIAEIKTLRISLEKTSTELESLKEKSNILSIEHEKYLSEKDTLKSTLNAEFYDKNIQSSKSDIDNHISKILAKIENTEKIYKELSLSIKDLEQQQTSTSTTIKLKTEQLSNILDEIGEFEKSIEQNIQQSKYESLDAVQKILSKNLNQSQIKQEIEDFRVLLVKLQNDLSSLDAEINGRVYDTEKHLELKKQQEALQAQIKQITEKIGSLQSEIEKTKDKLKLKLELLKEFAALELRKENIKTISKLFHARGFVNYISRIYLKQLCHIANKRFSLLTNRQLELFLSESNNFEVRDYMNGGKVRSVKTLSGGQTFQASLSLALALAESVQSQSETKQNFFFLDEGFGSLDRSSLQIVFDTLKSLRKENRIVGLISHVEELQEEIDIYLKLTNSPDNGTKISKSWKN